MLKIAVLFLSTVFAKLDNPNHDYIFHEWFNNLEQYPGLKEPEPEDMDAWVLSLDRDVDSLKLRRVSGDEVLEVFGAQLDDGPSQRQSSIRKKPKKLNATPKVGEKAMLSEIMRVINKFALTSRNEPEVDIEDTDKGLPTIKLYFKGALTTLAVRAEGRRWHYIIRHSLFPDWFYEEHEPGRDAFGLYVDVPKDVSKEFYNTLFHMLTMFLTFPV